ncbi:hypothetical protein [Bradyrhizobium sp. OAE829]|uniref:hypothetical protein n=1 Tax=Bradyrhizobium sp. OAE829 TaxID=2663807 RepID=UPI003395F198
MVAQALAAGKTQREAYQAAGYSYRPANAHRLCTDPAIEARVNEIAAHRYVDERRVREIAINEAGLDEAWIIKRLKYLTDVSLQGRAIKKNGVSTGEHTKPDGPTAVKCLTLAAKIMGMLVHRHEVGDPGEFSRMTDQELDACLRAQGRALGLPEDAIKKMLSGPTPSEAVQ